MKNHTWILLALVFLVFSIACEKVLKDENLTLKKSSYTGTELRLDGYYYFMNGQNLFETYFFYRNGISIHGGGNGSNTPPLQFIESQFVSESYLNSLKNCKTCWGIFRISGDNIWEEAWYPSSGGGLPVYIRYGKILNDTTFIITRSIHSKTGEENELNETYHFKQFSPKPDSTNKFI